MGSAEVKTEEPDPYIDRSSVSTSYTYSIGRDFSGKITSDDMLTVQRALTAPAADRKSRSGHACFAVSSFAAHRAFDRFTLSRGALSILTQPNAGGASEKSEAASFEFLRRMFGAQLVRTEMELEYEWTISKRTDFSVTVLGKRLGVSVTRAWKPAHKGAYSAEDALHLLQKKLTGVRLSTQDVIEIHAWDQQILHVLAPTAAAADLLRDAYAQMDAETKDNTVVLVTVTDNADWVYTNGAPGNNNAGAAERRAAASAAASKAAKAMNAELAKQTKAAAVDKSADERKEAVTMVTVSA